MWKVVNWTDKTVLITGAASGIGAALSRELADHGASLALMDVDEGRLAALVDEISRPGNAVLDLEVDVTDEEDVAKGYDRVRSELGGADMVVANAGVGFTTPATEMSPKDFKTIMDVNVQGVVNTIQPGLQDMLESDREGRIVIISSVLAFTALKGGAGYCASKAAVLRLGESLRLDLKDEPVSVTTIHPGWVETDMTREYSEKMRVFEITPETAAQKIRMAVEDGRDRAIFPWPMKFLFMVMDWLPGGILDWVRSKIPRLKRK